MKMILGIVVLCAILFGAFSLITNVFDVSVPAVTIPGIFDEKASDEKSSDEVLEHTHTITNGVCSCGKFFVSGFRIFNDTLQTRYIENGYLFELKDILFRNAEGTQFTSLVVDSRDGYLYVKYGTSSGNTVTAYSWDKGWSDEAHKTIQFKDSVECPKLLFWWINFYTLSELER